MEGKKKGGGGHTQRKRKTTATGDIHNKRNGRLSGICDNHKANKCYGGMEEGKIRHAEEGKKKKNENTLRNNKTGDIYKRNVRLSIIRNKQRAN